MRPTVIGLFIFGSRYNVSLHKVQKQNKWHKNCGNNRKKIRIKIFKRDRDTSCKREIKWCNSVAIQSLVVVGRVLGWRYTSSILWWITSFREKKSPNAFPSYFHKKKKSLGKIEQRRKNVMRIFFGIKFHYICNAHATLKWNHHCLVRVIFRRPYWIYEEKTDKSWLLSVRCCLCVYLSLLLFQRIRVSIWFVLNNDSAGGRCDYLVIFKIVNLERNKCLQTAIVGIPI